MQKIRLHVSARPSAHCKTGTAEEILIAFNIGGFYRSLPTYYSVIQQYKQPTRYNNNNFIDNVNQLNMFRAIVSPIHRSTRLCLQLVVSCTDDVACRQHRRCFTHPGDGRNYPTKHAELIEIINKIVIVVSSWLFILLYH